MPQLALSGEQYSSIGVPESMPLSGENLNKKHLSTTDRSKHIHPRVNSGNAKIFCVFFFFFFVIVFFQFVVFDFIHFFFFNKNIAPHLNVFKTPRANLDAKNTLCHRSKFNLVKSDKLYRSNKKMHRSLYSS